MGSNQDELYARARAIVEHAYGMPAYLCNDEIWYAAVDDARTELGITGKAPVCVYCGSIAPYGDERNVWISVHHSRLHRWWWNLKQKVVRR